MQLRMWLRACLTVLVAFLLLLPSLLGSAQSGTPAASPKGGSSAPSGQGFIRGDGVQSSLLGQTDVDLSGMAGPSLRLERIELPVGSKDATHTAIGNEVLYVVAGAIAIADGFGFSTETTAGQQLVFNAGTSYDLAQSGDVPTTIMRLRVADANEAPGAASAPAAVAQASPVVAEPTVTTLIDQPVEDIGSEAMIFLARAVYGPGANSGEQAHNGPLGIYVESGALTAMSPSGVEGQLKAGASAVLPASVSLIARNAGTEDAVVYLAGVTEPGDALVEEITPTPLPTMTPTATNTPLPTSIPTQTPIPPTPTKTPIPTNTQIPTNTLVPTPKPTSTPRPTPSPVPTTAVGTILQMGDTWIADGARVTLKVTDAGWSGFTIELTYTNSGSSRVDFSMPTSPLRVYDDQRNIWKEKPYFDKIGGDRVILDPGEARTYELGYDVPGDKTYSANVFIAVTGAGNLANGEWGLTWDKGRVLTLPPNVVDPLAPSGSTRGGQAASADAGSTDLMSLLPEQSDIPDGLVQLDKRSRSLADVTKNYTNPAVATQNFTSWGWVSNVVCSFGVPSGQTAQSGVLNGVYVSIHEFSNPEGAKQALDFSLTEQQTGQPLDEVDVGQFGDYTRGLYGTLDYGNETTILAQKGNLLIRVSAAMLDGDPTAKTQQIMTGILAKT